MSTRTSEKELALDHQIEALYSARRTCEDMHQDADKEPEQFQKMGEVLALLSEMEQHYKQQRERLLQPRPARKRLVSPPIEVPAEALALQAQGRLAVSVGPDGVAQFHAARRAGEGG